MAKKGAQRMAEVSRLRLASTGERRTGLNSGGPDDTLPPMTEEALKPRVDFLHTAFLWLAGIMVTSFLALITVNFTIASNANGRTDKVIETISGLNRQVGEVAAKQDETNRRLDRIEAKIDKLIEAKPK